MARLRKLYSENLSLLTRIRRVIGTRETLARWIFKQEFFGALNFHAFFDAGTIITRQALLKHVRPGMRVCEIGPGAYAILLMFLARRLEGVKVTGIEINPICAELAQVSAYVNHVPLRVIGKDFEKHFAENPEDIHQYDVIFSNAPYVPMSVIAGSNLPHLKIYQQLYEGSCHMEFIQKVVNVMNRTGYAGKLLITTNETYLPQQQLAEALEAAGFRVDDVVIFDVPVLRRVKVLVFSRVAVTREKASPAGAARSLPTAMAGV